MAGVQELKSATTPVPEVKISVGEETSRTSPDKNENEKPMSGPAGDSEASPAVEQD